jgi:hypothetical protein
METDQTALAYLDKYFKENSHDEGTINKMIELSA